MNKQGCDQFPVSGRALRGSGGLVVVWRRPMWERLGKWNRVLLAAMRVPLSSSDCLAAHQMLVSLGADAVR